jgi:hypothetical protein
VKENPIRLHGITTTDTEAIGKHLIRLYQQWKPEQDGKIGNLYGFDLYIRQQREAIEEKGAFGFRYYNTLYAEQSEGNIKYTYNNGHPNTDNPKLAARYFLNAIDRVETLKEKYEKTLGDLEKNIPKVATLASKPFEKEVELAQMKSELSNLERQISLKIQEKQMKQNGLLDSDKVKQENEIPKEAPVIQMVPKDVTLQTAMAKANGATISKENFKQNQVQQPRIKRSRGLRF